MNRHMLPHVLSAGLMATAAAPPADALPPLRVELVDELTLSQISGKYFGADMLVGLRVDLISTVQTPLHGSATAAGSLSIRRTGGGFEVTVDSRSSAVPSVDTATAATAAPANASATGAPTLQINGIGQVSQIAGDGNRMTNLTTIRFLSDPAVGSADPASFNGQTTSSTSIGGMTAQISFLDGGMELSVGGPGAALTQRLHSGSGVMQMGQLAGNDIFGSNQLQLQLMTRALSTGALHQLGIEQALAGLDGLGR